MDNKRDAIKNSRDKHAVWVPRSHGELMATALATLLTFAASWGAGGCAAGDSAEVGSLGGSRQEIQGGQLESGFPAVGEVRSATGFCTGVLIAPAFVLTAAHCAATTLTFSTGTGPTNFVAHAVDRQITHPSKDLLLLHLAQPISTIAPLEVNSFGLPGVGTTCTAVGFGAHDEANGSVTFETKRSATEQIETTDATTIEVVMVSGVADHGDSGGPLLCSGRIAAIVHNHTDGDWPSHVRENYATIDAGWIAAQLPGGMIVSDTNTNLAINAYGGAVHGADLRLVDNCSKLNPDCTWTYRDGMLLSNRDPALAVNAYGGAQNGTGLKLANNCTKSNTDCTWTYHKGMFVSDSNPSLAISPSGGAVAGASLRLTNTCSANNSDCTFTQQSAMVISGRNSGLAMNAYGGAVNQAPLKLVNNCAPDTTTCLWTLSKGMASSAADPTLAMNAFGGATHGTELRIVNNCSPSNTDCTWTIHQGQWLSDTVAGLAMNAFGGAQHGTVLKLVNNCTSSNPDCLFIRTRYP